METKSSLIDIKSMPIAPLLPLLLADKTTKSNIIWATDTYASYGAGYQSTDAMYKLNVYNHGEAILPRIEKTSKEQSARTRKRAEVFTPVWLCCEMNNYLDEEWFGRKDVFNVLHDDHTWTVVEEPIAFPKGRTWKQYIDSRRLEITCGEAPFLVSRYDAATGVLIVPPKRRIGLLDRKMRIVGENTKTEADWMKWAIRAFQSVYGYEYQGDNLLIARVNLVNTFIDYYRDKWNKEPDLKALKKVATIVSWNIWQMDGLTDRVPTGKVMHVEEQDMLAEDVTEYITTPYCAIKDWRKEHPIVFHDLKNEQVSKK